MVCFSLTHSYAVLTSLTLSGDTERHKGQPVQHYREEPEQTSEVGEKLTLLQVAAICSLRGQAYVTVETVFCHSVPLLQICC